MRKNGRNLTLGGCFLAVLMTALIVGGTDRQPAEAQTIVQPIGPPIGGLPGKVGRYQLSAFTIQQGQTPGAYILDTQTGEVFQVVGKDRPERIGTVTQPQTKKKAP